MSSNRAQHVIPQFYLRGFADCNGFLWCLHKADQKLFHTTPPNIAHERDAFAIGDSPDRDASFDQINNNVEAYSAPQLKRLLEGQFDKEVINAVWALSANLLTRSRC